MAKGFIIWLIAIMTLLFTWTVTVETSFAQTSPATLTWDPPTTNADGTPLTDLAGYKVYYRYPPDVAHSPLVTLAGTVTCQLGKCLEQNEYEAVMTPPASAKNVCFVMTAYDTANNESAKSNEVCKDLVAPGALLLKIIFNMPATP